jgi:hypothetical protein
MFNGNPTFEAALFSLICRKVERKLYKLYGTVGKGHPYTRVSESV